MGALMGALMIQKYRRLALLTMVLCCTGTAGNALAAPDQPTPGSVNVGKQGNQAQTSAPTTPFSNNQVIGLPTLTVTGTPISRYRVSTTNTALGTNTSVLNTPFAVTPIPREVLRDQRAQSLEDAMRNSPGVTINLGEGNRDELIIRGVKTKAAFFINGMRDNSEYFRPLYNVAHIDVLKGPAALQFGRGNIGGLVNIVTRKAERRDIRHLMVSGGSFGRFKGWFDFGTAVGSSGAFRLMGMGERSNGFRDYSYIHRYGINPTFHLDLSDRTHMDVSFSYLDDNRRVDRGIPSFNGRPVKVDRTQFFGSPDQNRFYSHLFSGAFNITHEVNKHLTLRNRFRAFQNKHHYANVFPGSSVDANGMFQFEGYDHLTKRLSAQDRFEAIINFDTGIVHHKVFTGASYTWQQDHDIELVAGTKANGDTTKDIPGLHSLSDSVVAPVPLNVLRRNNTVYAHEIGVFLQDQISLGKHWMLLAGLRYDRFATTARYLPSRSKTEKTNNTWSPRFALMYKPIENDTMYFSFSRNYVPAGANVALSLETPKDANIAPERADQYEFGNKLELFDGNLALNVAFFQINLDNLPTSPPNGGLTLITIGKRRNRGIELSANGNITDKWRIFTNYTYMLEAKNLVAIEDAPAGTRAGLVPHHQFSVWSTYDLDQHWGVGAGVHGLSSRFTSFTNEVTLPSFVVGDLMAYYQQKQFRLQVNVYNVSNESYFATASGDNQIMPGTPRSVIASLNVNF